MVLLALLFACVPTESGVPEGPFTPTLPAAPVDARVVQDYDFVDGVVYVHEPDGTFVSKHPLDVVGHARIEHVPPGGQLTFALVSELHDRLLYTVRDVFPGDEVWGGVGYTPPDRRVVEIDVDASAVDGASRVVARAGCDRRTSPVVSTPELEVEDLCEGDSASAVVESMEGEPLAYAVATGLEAVDGALVTFGADDWRTDFLSVDVSTTNSGATDGHLTHTLIAQRGASVLDEHFFDASLGAGGTRLWHAELAVHATDRVRIMSEHGRMGSYSSSTYTVPTPAPGEGLQVSLDMATRQLPEVEVMFDGHTLEARSSGPLRCDGAGDADLMVWRAATYEGPYGDSQGWMVVVDGTTPRVDLPDLGPDAPLWWSTDGSLVQASVAVLAVQDADYEDLRDDVGSQLEQDGMSEGDRCARFSEMLPQP